MLKEDTLDKERRKYHFNIEWEKLSPDEAAFLEGALFALDWVKGGVRRFSPSRFIEWRKKNDPYKVRRHPTPHEG